LNTEVNRILGLETTKAAQERAGAQPMPMSTEAFDAFLRQDIARQAEWIRMAKMTPA
jgi:tripartite-type tricarboxylate transporter receptor subunit TctC